MTSVMLIKILSVALYIKKNCIQDCTSPLYQHNETKQKYVKYKYMQNTSSL